MLLSAVSVFVVAQSSSEIPEGLMNNPVHHFLLANGLVLLGGVLRMSIDASLVCPVECPVVLGVWWSASVEVEP